MSVWPLWALHHSCLPGFLSPPFGPRPPWLNLPVVPGEGGTSGVRAPVPGERPETGPCPGPVGDENREACDKASSLAPLSARWPLIPACPLHPQIPHWLLCGLVPRSLSVLGPEQPRGGKTQLVEWRPGETAWKWLGRGSWGSHRPQAVTRDPEPWRTSAREGLPCHGVRKGHTSTAGMSHGCLDDASSRTAPTCCRGRSRVGRNRQ